MIITIVDQNDNCPTFDETQYYGQITTEDFYVVEQGKVEFLLLKASDEDSVRASAKDFVLIRPSSRLGVLHRSCKKV